MLFMLNKSIISYDNLDMKATGARYVNGMGYGCHYKDVEVDENTIIFLLNDEFAPKGYAYAIPYGKNEISIVITSFQNNNFRNMNLLFQNLINKIKIFSDLTKNAVQGDYFAKIGFYSIPETARIKNTLLVGEAAGFVEADRGFGMHYALESGYLASKALSENSDYDLLWKKSFEIELLKAFRKRLILNKLGNKYYDQLINAGTKMSIKEYVEYKEKHSVNIIKKLLLNLHTMNELKKLRNKYKIR